MTDDGSKSDRNPQRGWIVIIIFVLGLFAFDLTQQIIFGRLPFTDEVWFKSPGLEWSRSGRMAAPELAGFPLDPPLNEVFATQAPTYALAFGVWTRAAGFGEWQAIVFDSTIRFLLIGCSLVLIKLMTGQSRTMLFVICSLVLYSLGFYGRPDDLAITFAVLSMILFGFVRSQFISSIGGGFCFGLCVATSPGVTIVWALPILVVWMFRWIELKRNLMLVLQSMIGFSIGVAPAIAFYLSHDGAFQQFRQHSAIYVGQSILPAWKRAFEVAPSAIVPYIVALALIVILLYPTIRRHLQPRIKWLTFSCLASYALVFVVAPGKFPYAWFLAPLVACILNTLLSSVAPSTRRIVIITLGLVLLGSNLDQINRWIDRARLPVGGRYDEVVGVVKSHVPPGSRIISDSFWSEIALDRTYYDAFFGGENLLDQTDFVLIRRQDTFDAWSEKSRAVLSDPNRFKLVAKIDAETPYRFFLYERITKTRDDAQ